MGRRPRSGFQARAHALGRSAASSIRFSDLHKKKSPARQPLFLRRRTGLDSFDTLVFLGFYSDPHAVFLAPGNSRQHGGKASDENRSPILESNEASNR